jgi:hypothetical protein
VRTASSCTFGRRCCYLNYLFQTISVSGHRQKSQIKANTE